MAKNQTGIAIVIKALLPTGSTIDEQFEALGIVKAAHASGDYTALLKAAKVDEVKTEQKTRRVEDEPATTATSEPELVQQIDALSEPSGFAASTADEPTTAGTDEPSDEAVPDFLKPGKRKTA